MSEEVPNNEWLLLTADLLSRHSALFLRLSRVSRVDKPSVQTPPPLPEMDSNEALQVIMDIALKGEKL